MASNPIFRLAVFFAAACFLAEADGSEQVRNSPNWRDRTIEAVFIGRGTNQIVKLTVPGCEKGQSSSIDKVEERIVSDRSDVNLETGVRIRQFRSNEQAEFLKRMTTSDQPNLTKQFSQAVGSASGTSVLLLGKDPTGLRLVTYRLWSSLAATPLFEATIKNSIGDVLAVGNGHAFAMIEEEFLGHEMSVRGFMGAISGHPIEEYQYYLRVLSHCANAPPLEVRQQLAKGAFRIAWLSPSSQLQSAGKEIEK